MALVDVEEAHRALQVLWELMVQCGPVANLHLPRDKITTTHQGCDLGQRSRGYSANLQGGPEHLAGNLVSS